MEPEIKQPNSELDDVVEKLKEVSVKVQPVGIVTHNDVCKHVPDFRKECDHVEQPRRVSDTIDYLLKVLSTYHSKDLRISTISQVASKKDEAKPMDDIIDTDIVVLQDFLEADVDIIKLTHDAAYTDRALNLFEELYARHKKGDLRAGESAIPRSRTKKTDREDLIFSFNLDMYACPESKRSMLLSTGGVIETVNKVHSGLWRSAFTILRPPGHHSHQAGVDGLPTGFCFFNNVAIAANYLRHQHGYKRILIFDWDVHHGDGTQQIFASDPDILFVSVHQYDNGAFYPEKSGDPSFIGTGKGTNFTLNVGWDLQETGNELLDEELVYLFERALLPRIKEFAPQFILVSAGFDSCRGDPLGWYLISPRAYYHILTALQVVQPKTVVCLEGGYNLTNLQECAYSVVSSLSGLDERTYKQAAKHPKPQSQPSPSDPATALFLSKNWQLAPYSLPDLFPQSFALSVTKSSLSRLPPTTRQETPELTPISRLELFRAAMDGFFTEAFTFNCTHWCYSVDTQKRQAKIAKCLGKTGVWGSVVYTNEDTVVGQWKDGLKLKHGTIHSEEGIVEWVTIEAHPGEQLTSNLIEVEWDTNADQPAPKLPNSKKGYTKSKSTKPDPENPSNIVQKKVRVSYTTLLIAALTAGKEMTS